MVNNYYPFGMLQPGREFNADKYRFGFNGKENFNEVDGIGNLQDYGARMYSTKLGRFPSPDPLIIYGKQYLELSPYQFASNTPIQAIDLDGLEAANVTQTAQDFQGTPYEFGGKDPAFKNGLPEDKTEQWYSTYVGKPSSENGSRYNNPNYTNEINLNQYLTNGKTSCGIDCSGLAGTAFNSDKEKLMPDFKLNSQGANDQKQAFMNAEKNKTGRLTTFVGDVRKGDLVFNGNSTTTATHVMVATGQVNKTKDGKTQIQIIQAPETGKYVETIWKNVQSNWSYGQTRRTTDPKEIKIVPFTDEFNTQ